MNLLQTWPFFAISIPFLTLCYFSSLARERRDNFRRMKARADRKHYAETCQHEADRWQDELYQRPNSIHFSK
jgi:hypothetical protein